MTIQIYLMCRLQLLLGKGGSITVKKTKSKKRPKMPEEVEAELEERKAIEAEYLTEIDGFESLGMG